MYFLLLKIDSEVIFYAWTSLIMEEYMVRIGNLAVNILYGQKIFRFQKKYFRIFQKSLDISEIEISFPTSTRGFAHVIQKRDFINQIRTRYTEISGASGISPTSGLKCPS